MTKTIILIDDDQDDLEIMKEAIHSVDETMVCVGFIRPEEALRFLLKQELLVLPDYIFIDINMPGLSGDKCLKALRREKTFNDTVITLYSTSMPAPVAEALKISGANYVFEKPVKLKAYAEILRNIFAKKDAYLSPIG